MNGKVVFVERKVDIKLIIMSAWVALMCLYLYCDFFSLYRPGQLGSISSGKMGPFDISQAGLFWAGVLMVIPSLMILVSTLAPASVNRILNLVAKIGRAHV